MTTQPLLQDWNVVQPSRTEVRYTEWRILRVALLVLDALTIGAAIGLSYVLRFTADLPLFYMPQEIPVNVYSTLVFWLIPAWLIVFSLYHLYDPHYLLSGLDEYSHIGQATTMGMMLLLVGSFLDPTFIIAPGWVVLA